MSGNANFVCPTCGQPVQPGQLRVENPKADVIQFVSNMLDKHYGMVRTNMPHHRDWDREAIQLWAACGENGQVLVEAITEAVQDSGERAIIFASPRSFLRYAADRLSKFERARRLEDRFLGGGKNAEGS